MNEASPINPGQSDDIPFGTKRRGNRRRLWFVILGLVILAVAAAFALYWFLYAVYFVSTDDAYVGGDLVAVTARAPGAVIGLHADNTQAVRRGQLLISLDPVEAQVAVDAAKAELARTVRSVRAAFARVEQARAQLASAEVARTQVQNDLRRREAAGNAVSREELAHARSGVVAAEAAVQAAQGTLTQALSAVQGTEIANNPDVLAAAARLRQAAIQLAHMSIRAPVDGVVAQRTVQIGQHIAAGTPLMAVVPLNTVWVDANFKEVQLADVRIGQKATITSDIYGSGVEYHGRVQGLGAGSGNAFALLPPQNATGNWIKIVQRVPVRIALDPKELRRHPLRVGLSVTVSIDVSDTSGSMVASTAPLRDLKGEPGDGDAAEIEHEIAAIIAANSN
ncbi:MAG: efflux RND transporter periplasmic adaptor subunit [Proteobacteria bacterium]|nr:efflux RND transporter periplasmic adaptor subunit [Pseudomonadota bacterium]